MKAAQACPASQINGQIDFLLQVVSPGGSTLPRVIHSQILEQPSPEQVTVNHVQQTLGALAAVCIESHHFPSRWNSISLCLKILAEFFVLLGAVSTVRHW
jgi:hypothetical protein